MIRMFRLASSLFGLGIILAGCTTAVDSSGDIEAVQEQYESQLMSVPGVVGVGIGECDSQPCLKVFVEAQNPDLQGQIPAQLEGFKVEIEVIGPVEIQSTPGSSPTASVDIEAVQERYESQLMSLPGVVGVGIGQCAGQLCLKVFVKERTPELDQQIPAQLEGFKVEIEVTGPIEIQPK